MSSVKDAQNFEKGRIKALQDERVYIQKKTFTKWANAFLEKARYEIKDLFTDLADGKMLMKLLEIISGENLGRPNKGILRVQKVENCNRCLKFLATKVYFENIGAEDIVDGNPRLILGLIWTIILRFQIQEITIEVDEEDETGEKKSAKDALLLWCQRKTAGYPGVDIRNFTNSWRNGLGFNALIHAHRPDLIDYEELHPAEHVNNLNNAFNVADDQLGIPKILDPQDVDVDRPDEKIILTYVASYYHYFAKMKSEMTGGKRIAKILGMVKDIEKMVDDYETLTSSLQEWIRKKILQLNDRRFPNSREGIQKELIGFKEYRTVEKPPKYREKGNIEVQYFNIQARLKANGQKLYTPPEGKLIHDIESAWLLLEKAEHGREVALRDELIRQERLEQLAQRFNRKAEIRDAWLTDMYQILDDKLACNNAAQAEAAIKKHEAISAEILARKDRFQALNSLAKELVEGRYHAKEAVQKRDQQIMEKWNALLAKLDQRKTTLSGFDNLMSMFREIESIQEEVKEVESKVKLQDCGKHLLAVENYLQQHSLVESQLHALTKRVRNLNRRSRQLDSTHPEAQALDKRLGDLNKEFDRVNDLSNKRRKNLDLAKSYYQFIQDAEEEEQWVQERIDIAKSTAIGKDLNAARVLLKKHEGMEAEMAGRWPNCEQVCSTGQDLVNSGHEERSEIGQRIKTLMDKWKQLRDLALSRKTRLEDAIESQQYYADANDAESWMREKMPLVTSDDYGRDEASSQALLSRQNRMNNEITAFKAEIKRLDELSQLMTKAAGEHNISLEKFIPAENGEKSDEEEYVEEVVNVPHEIEVDEIVEKEVIQDVVETRKIPQVRAMYGYRGQGMKADKGEVMILVQRTNPDWWQVKKEDGSDGFVPANYVKEIEPKVVQKVVQKPTKVPEKVKVKKTVMKKEVVQKKKEQDKSAKLRRAPSVRSKANLHFDKENVESRQKTINLTYNKLVKLAQARKISLQDAVNLFKFYSECDEFETWMKGQEQVLAGKESLADNIEAVRKKFENLLTALAANKGRLDDINKLADEIVNTGTSQKEKVLKRKHEINDRWNRLNKLKMDKEKNLEGASSIELFKSTCDELGEWIKEKDNALAVDDIGKDLKGIQAQQRRHANLERELVPMEEKMKRMQFLADTVRSSYPDEKGYVDHRQDELEKMWDALKRKAAGKKGSLDDHSQQHTFAEDAKDLSSWAKMVRARLASAELPRDVQTAEKMMKEHAEVMEDVKAHKPEFRKLNKLGADILKKDPGAQDVKDKLQKLQDDEKAIDEMCEKRKKQLQDAYNLQLFNKEADNIDSVTGSHEKFLAFGDLGETVDDVESLFKRHEDFESTLQAQDDKIKALNDLADRLIAEGHPDAERIDAKRREVMARRQKVKDLAKERHNALLASQGLQEFKRDADELSSWMKDKYKTATEEDYRDLSNLPEKLKKHVAFEAELKANKDQLEGLNKQGNAMVADGHNEAPEIQKILDGLNHQWKDLYNKSSDKGNKLRQATEQQTLNKALADAQDKLDEMEKSVANPDVGSDLRGVKALLKKHQMLENDLGVLADQIQSIVTQGQALADAGHFDKAGILKAVDNFNRRFGKLKPAVAHRKQKLQDSLHFQQFKFDADEELQWIKEHLPAASSIEYGKSLIDAQNLSKNHQKLELEIQGHQPIEEKVVARGDKLIEEKHFASKQIKDKTQELQLSWDDLLNKAKIRKKNLDLSVQIQRYLSDVAEIEGWINEKMSLASSTDYGKDENAADKLLAKNKVLEADIQTYQGITNGLGKEAQRLFKIGCQDPSTLRKAQDNLQDQLNKLKRNAAERSRNLEQSKRFHSYQRETGDFEEWINEQMQIANSEEYGQDYEHLLILRDKFDEFRRTVEAGTERYNRCERQAKWLLDDKGKYTSQVQESQNQLSEAWNMLLEAIDARDQKLYGAGEIHRFNRDVEDALTRIQEKYQSIPDDLGRDLNATQSYLKKHEGFENELVALEAQLQVLIDDSKRLQETYPGENAEQIEQLQATVVSNWGVLQDRATKRKEELLEAADLHRFHADVRDLLSWAGEIEHEMKAEKPVKDVHSVDLLRTRHDQLKAEIDARDDTFTTVAQTGQTMIDNGHYASDDIAGKVKQVLAVRDRLRATWKDRKQYHDQLYDVHVFLRDAQQLDTISSSQEAYLASTDFGSTIDQVEALTRKHEAFDKVLAVQEEKLEALKDHGSQLINSKHFEAPRVNQTLGDVIKKRGQIKNQSALRKENLGDSLLYAQFNRDAVEAEGWIDDKQKTAYEDDFQDVNELQLQDKMRKLQKHQAFEAEIVANTDRINKIKELGDLLIKKKHPRTDDIRQRESRLMSKWTELLRASENRGKGLEEARDILEFQEQVDKVEAWIREKEALVHAGDLGRDYEHCMELQKKANNQEQAGITVNEDRIKSINNLADKLISQGRTDTSVVKQKRNDMNKKWKNLQGSLGNYKQKLAAALEIHSFNRDVDDINERINEKAMLLSVEDLGKDLPAVQALQRKQEEIERDMTALQNQLEKIETLAGKLCRKYPDMGTSIVTKQQEAQDNWEKLEDLSDQRKVKLAESYQLQKFLTDARELISWSTDMINRINSGELAKDVTEAENLIQLHHERKAEIDGRKPHFTAVRDHGNKLIEKKHYGAEEIQKTVGQLDKTKLSLSAAWDKRNHLLTQCHNLQVFKETAEQTDNWLGGREAFLANEDLGNNLYSVESLVKKHEGFEKTTQAQQDRVDDLKQFAVDLKEQEHYAIDEIDDRCTTVLDRTVRLWDTSKARGKKLEDSRNYQLFLRNIYEVSGWINEKLQMALDESYRDPTNLQAKLQKHQAFEAEVTANRNRVDAVVEEGQGLIDQPHYASLDIKKRLEELETSWDALMAASAEKKDRLQDAYQALMFNRVVDDLLSWIDEIENQLMSEDHGKDLVSVNNLLKKHQLLELDIANHQDKVTDVMEAAQEFRENKHFMNKELQARAKEVTERYNSLSEPCHIRRDNLEDALAMYQFYRDVEDELSWIQEKKPIAASADFGNSLTAVQNLMKKHQALESEIVAHEPLIDAVSNAAQQMIKNKHFAAQDIEKRLEELHKELQELMTLSSARKLKLQDSLESQKFYSEITEAESWMNEKIPVLRSPDFGKDEDSVQGLLKKLDALERDIDNFSNNIGELSALSRSLVDRGHYDSENIKKQQAAVENRYSQLQDLTNQRRAKLNDSMKLFEFYREADEVATWISEKGTIAASEDYGTDLEHVEILQQKFQDFIHELQGSEDRVTTVTSMAKAMIDAGHFESTKIQIRSDEISQMWAELRDVTQARQEALLAAKQVHMYGRDADDTLEWIQEKDAVVSSDDYGHDLESVQSLISRHDGMERDLAAISEQVEAITKEAERLIDLFPDAQEHIAAKHEEMVQSWNNLVEKATLRKEKLQQAGQLQTYFNDYRELTAWISEMMAIIMAEEPAKDLPGAEVTMTRCKEHKAEIDSRQEPVTKFRQTGQAFIDNGHFLSEEIQEKVHDLNDAWEGLLRTQEQHRIICEQNLEAQHLKHEMEQLEVWMNIREPVLKEKNYGNSIQNVEELLRRQQDFEKTVDSQEEKFTSITRSTQLEQTMLSQKQRQEAADIARREMDRLEEIRRREQERILEERKREEEQRKAREVLLRRQKGDAALSDDDKDDDREKLDKNVVKNLIQVGRSQSIKMTGKADGENKGDVRRAISFKAHGDGSISPPPVLHKAVEFRQGEGVVRKPSQKDENEEDAPRLPEGPPPLVQPVSEAASPGSPSVSGLTKKEKLSSPPVSPKQQRVDLIKEEKKSKRTPSFNIRRRTRSFKDKYKLPENLPPAELEGLMERKHELQTGGKKAAIRSWKSFYSVLFGQLLCFFKDKEAYTEKAAAAPPLNLHNAHCEIASNYTKKKNVLRLKLHDGAEFLLEVPSAKEMSDWLNKIMYYSAVNPEELARPQEHTDLTGHSSSPDARSGGSVSPSEPVPQKESPREEPVREAGEHIRHPSDQSTPDKGSPVESMERTPSFKDQHGEETDLSASYLVSDQSRLSHTSSLSDGHEDHEELPSLPVSSPPNATVTAVPEHEDIADDSHETNAVKVKPKPSPRQPRPVSEPVAMGDHDHDHEEKEKKKKGMFGFLKKKKDKDGHHKDHDEHKEHKKHDDHKKHKKDKDKEKVVEKY